MSFRDNQSKAIAAFLCPLLRGRSPKVSFECLASDDDEMFHTAIKMLQMFGLRKGFFQSRRSFVLESLLFSEPCFETASAILELRTTVPHKASWSGAGEFKETSARDGLAISSMFSGMMALGPSALIEINISQVWDGISGFLEKVDAEERAAERNRKDMEALERIPKYNGPPATPEQTAEIERILSQIRNGNKANE